MPDYDISLVSVWIFRTKGDSDRQWARDLKRRKMDHQKSERLRQAHYQRSHNGSLRGYRPVKLVIVEDF